MSVSTKNQNPSHFTHIKNTEVSKRMFLQRIPPKAYKPRILSDRSKCSITADLNTIYHFQIMDAAVTWDTKISFSIQINACSIVISYAVT